MLKVKVVFIIFIFTLSFYVESSFSLSGSAGAEKASAYLYDDEIVTESEKKNLKKIIDRSGNRCDSIISANKLKNQTRYLANCDIDRYIKKYYIIVYKDGNFFVKRG